VCYFDTSFLVPLVLAEATSTAVSRFVGSLPNEHRATSVWTRVELGSLLGTKVRRGELLSQAAAETQRRFDTLLVNFELIVPEADDFTLATSLLSDFARGLRSGDALHIAVALRSDTATLYSLDKAMLRACRHVGLEATTGIAVPGYEVPQ
jgi:predicted nucleic acid-binding protein